MIRTLLPTRASTSAPASKHHAAPLLDMETFTEEDELRMFFQSSRLWTAEEDEVLLRHALARGTKHWGELHASGRLPRRDNKACCNRFLFLKKRFLEQRASLSAPPAGAAPAPIVVSSRQGPITLGTLSLAECDTLFLPSNTSGPAGPAAPAQQGFTAQGMPGARPLHNDAAMLGPMGSNIKPYSQSHIVPHPSSTSQGTHPPVGPTPTACVAPAHRGPGRVLGVGPVNARNSALRRHGVADSASLGPGVPGGIKPGPSTDQSLPMQGKFLGSLMLEHSLLAASSDLSSRSTASTTASEVPAVTWAPRPQCPPGSHVVPSLRPSSFTPGPAAVPFMGPRAPSVSLSGPYPRSQVPDPVVRCAVTEPVMLPGRSGSHGLSSDAEGFFVGPAVHAAARAASAAASTGMAPGPRPWLTNEPGFAQKRTRAEAHSNQAQEAAAQELMAPFANPLLAGPQASAGMLAQGVRQQPGAQHTVRPLLASQMLSGLQAWASWPAGVAMAARKVGRMTRSPPAGNPETVSLEAQHQQDIAALRDSAPAGIPLWNERLSKALLSALSEPVQLTQSTTEPLSGVKPGSSATKDAQVLPPGRSSAAPLQGWNCQAPGLPRGTQAPFPGVERSTQGWQGRGAGGSGEDTRFERMCADMGLLDQDLAMPSFAGVSGTQHAEQEPRSESNPQKNTAFVWASSPQAVNNGAFSCLAGPQAELHSLSPGLVNLGAASMGPQVAEHLCRTPKGEPVESHRCATGPPPLSLDRDAGDASSAWSWATTSSPDPAITGGGGGGWGPEPGQTLHELDMELRAMEALLSHGLESDIDWDLRGGNV